MSTYSTGVTNVSSFRTSLRHATSWDLDNKTSTDDNSRTSMTHPYMLCYPTSIINDYCPELQPLKINNAVVSSINNNESDINRNYNQYTNEEADIRDDIR